MNLNLPSISAVLVSWNRSELLKKAIESLRKQSYPNIEFIVVDNGSTDDSLDWLRKDDSLKLIENNRNRGASAARNQGTACAKSDYVIYMDSDAVLITENALEKMVKYLEDNPDTAGSAGIYYSDDDMKELWCWSPCMDWEGNHDLDASLKPKPNPPVLSTCFCMFRRDVLNEIGGFDEFYPYLYEDADICDRIRKQGYRLTVDPEVKVVHYYAKPGRTQRGQIKYHYYHERLRTYFVLKNWGVKRYFYSWLSKIKNPMRFRQQFNYLPWVCYIDIYWIRSVALLIAYPWVRQRRYKKWIVSS